ncbi:hypothetical protein ES288_D08G157100v1 [Gossypium darwinii]|uniref:Uncharacterized protein n=1 Tax=Gossypium darwinii TaxID=34276 RepID=A0A5D2BJV4_GOSDA|nr:hypothetical protein ES288_D08G157100v1 [Gossypium darwinii]
MNLDLNPEGRRAQQFIANAVATKEDSSAASSSSKPGIPIDFLQGDKFCEAAVSYIKPLLTKGVPSLFSDLSPLYDHPGKADMLEQLILELEHSIRINGRYPDSHYSEVGSCLKDLLKRIDHLQWQ